MGSQAWGVSPCGKGWAVRVRAEDYSSVLKTVQPEEERAKFDGKRWEIAKLPLSWWKKEHVTEFLENTWHVTPLYSIRNGMTRTWVVAAKEDPIATKIQHDFGLAHIRSKLQSLAQKEIKVWKPPKQSGLQQQQQKPAADGVAAKQTSPATHAQKPAASGHRRQESGDSAVALPAQFWEQMKVMIQSAIAPLQHQNATLTREIAAIKSVMDGDEEEQEDESGVQGQGAEEDTKDAAMAESESTKRSSVPELAGMPPHKKVAATHRTGPYQTA